LWFDRQKTFRLAIQLDRAHVRLALILNRSLNSQQLN